MAERSEHRRVVAAGFGPRLAGLARLGSDRAPLSRRVRWALVALVVVAAGLRIAWSLRAAQPPGPALNDPVFYTLHANQIADGLGYTFPDGTPTAYYPVGYPAALGLLFLLARFVPFGMGQVGLVAALNVVSQSILVLAVFGIARRLLPVALDPHRHCAGADGSDDDRRAGAPAAVRTPAWPELAGLVGAAIVALWPNLVLHTSVALSESLFLALFCGALYGIVAGPWGDGARPSTARLVVVALLFALASLVRPISLPVAGIVVLAWWWGIGWRAAVRGGVALALGMVIVLGPWVARNASVMDTAAISLNTGDNLCMSRRVGGTGGFEFPNERCFPPRFEALVRPELEVARDEHGRELAFEFVREHPGEEVRLWFRRIGATLHADHDAVRAAEGYGAAPFLSDDSRALLTDVSDGWYYVMGPLGLVGLVRLAAGRRPAGVLVAGTVLAVLVPPVLFFGDLRFKVPAVPLAAAAGAALLVEVAAGVDARRRGADGAPPPATTGSSTTSG